MLGPIFEKKSYDDHKIVTNRLNFVITLL